MILENVLPGNKAPDEINVIVEIPALSDPIKYEVDKETGAMFVDRFMLTCMHYPCNYGYVPKTLSEDGDPIDVLVPTPNPLISGSVIQCRPVGVLNMEDESGIDTKIIAVPVRQITPLYDDVIEASDLPSLLLNQIRHFFEHYKDLDDGKWVKVVDWSGAAAAKQQIQDSIQRYYRGDK